MYHRTTNLAPAGLKTGAYRVDARCQGCSTVGVFAYRFISSTSFCPHPGSSCTVSSGESIGVVLPPLFTLTN